MDPIALEDLALMDVLRRIDASQPLEGDGELLPRLVESGLVDDEGDIPTLTVAGVEMCKSLQHRVAADAQAAKILEERGADAGTDEVPADEASAADGRGAGSDGNGDGRSRALETSATP
jgi:hypothetical protein